MKLPIKEKSSNIFIVAEAGNNHEGSLQHAIDLVGHAADSGADAIKFQSFITKNYIKTLLKR